MLDIFQKKLKLHYSSNVLDVVLFGSSVLEGSSPNDLDIAVVFGNGVSVKTQLEEGQKIKKQIMEITSLPVQIQNYTLESLFKESNFAREGILFYGISLLDRKFFSLRLGLKPVLRINYILSDLEKKEKIRFNYLLNGKAGSYGMLRKHGGRIVAPGVLETEPKNELIFTSEMKKITPKIKIERILMFLN